MVNTDPRRRFAVEQVPAEEGGSPFRETKAVEGFLVMLGILGIVIVWVRRQNG